MENWGEEVDLIPKVPKHPMNREDKSIERVCCSTSIIGCIKSTFMIPRIKSYNDTWYRRLCKGEGQVPFYVYSLPVPCLDVIQPRTEQLPDVFITNEFWVTEAYTWPLLGKFYIRKASDIGDIYSMWRVQKELDARGPVWNNLPINIGFESITGDFDNFAFIDINPYLFDKKYNNGKQMSKEDREKITNSLLTDIMRTTN